MGRKYSTESNTITHPLASDVMNAMGLSPDEVRYHDCSHCETLEELEFEIFAELLNNGIPEKEARRRAKEEARDMWEANLEVEKGF